jgi:hypothetical protein
MKRNCTTCKKSNDGSPCDPPERSAAAQWIYDNQVNALTNREYIKKCDGCFDHEPRKPKWIVCMEIEPYVDEEGREWCCKSSLAETCIHYQSCVIYNYHGRYGREHFLVERPQACIDAEIREEEQSDPCITCRYYTMRAMGHRCVPCINARPSYPNWAPKF